MWLLLSSSLPHSFSFTDIFISFADCLFECVSPSPSLLFSLCVCVCVGFIYLFMFVCAWNVLHSNQEMQFAHIEIFSNIQYRIEYKNSAKFVHTLFWICASKNEWEGKTASWIARKHRRKNDALTRTNNEGETKESEKNTHQREKDLIKR